MLDRNDKQWITEILDEKLSDTKTELRGEMHEMEDNVLAKVSDQIADRFLEELKEQVTAIYENTYQEYLKLIGENVPDKIRSYDRIDEKQQKHQDEMEKLRSIAYNHENIIARLEKAAY